MSRQEEDLGFAVPDQEEEQECISRPVAEHTKKEGDISLLWLLHHYNREYAAAYKAQRKKKKSEKNSAKQAGKRRKRKDIKKDHQERLYQERRYADSEKRSESIEHEDGNHFGATVMVDRQERPGLIEAKIRPEASLECVGFGETVPLLQIPFMIGRSSQGVDLCIADNKMVGRRHAVISFRNGQYYIQDLNSLNHVFVDDVQIQPEKEIQLHDQAKIMLGNEIFIFHLRKQ